MGPPLPDTPPRLEPLLVVLGAIHLDVMVRLEHLPRPNDRLLPLEVVRAPGGMGGNVAAAFARLGGRVRFAGSFGDSDDGRFLRADLEREGVDTRFAAVDPAITPSNQGLILVGEAGARAMFGMLRLLIDAPRISGRGAPARQSSSAELARLRAGWLRRLAEPWRPPAELLDDASGLYCPGAYAPAVLAALPPALPLFVDIEAGHTAHWSAETLRAVLGRASVVFCNEGSLPAITGTLGTQGPAELAGYVGGALALTLGEAGCVVFDDGEPLCAPGFPVDAVDTTGAGDCFAAAFVLAALRGAPLAACARFANGAAALSTRGLGSRTTVPTADELAAWLAERGA